MFTDAKPAQIHAAHIALTGQQPAAHHTCARLIHDLAATYGRHRLGNALAAATRPAASACLSGMALA